MYLDPSNRPSPSRVYRRHSLRNFIPNPDRPTHAYHDTGDVHVCFHTRTIRYSSCNHRVQYFRGPRASCGECQSGWQEVLCRRSICCTSVVHGNPQGRALALLNERGKEWNKWVEGTCMVSTPPQSLSSNAILKKKRTRILYAPNEFYELDPAGIFLISLILPVKIHPYDANP